MQYRYTARNREQGIVTGFVDGESEHQVRSQLIKSGLTPLEVRSGLTRGGRRGKRVKLKDLAVFSRQFAAMIASGLTILRALTVLTDQVSNLSLRVALQTVATDIQSGLGLSDALAKHPDIFPPLMIQNVRAGEGGGFLETSLDEVANNFESEVKLRGKIKSALTYPLVVFAFSIVMLVVMLVFVVPTFAKMFKGLGSSLPLPTEILIDVSHVMKYGFPLFIIAGLLAAAYWRRFKNAEHIRNIVDPLKLRLPVFGALFQRIALARFARNLSTLLSSGVSILEALDVVADTTGSVVISRALQDIKASVRQGESIKEPMSKHSVFPSMVVEMIAVGEESGTLSAMLAKVAEFYDAEVESTTEQLTSLIEPIMIMVLGSLVGAMVVCLYLPIFDIYNKVQ